MLRKTNQTQIIMPCDSIYMKSKNRHNKFSLSGHDSGPLGEVSGSRFEGCTMLPLGLMVIYIVLYDLCSFLPVYYPEIIGF